MSRTRALTHDVREIELTLIEPAVIDFMPGQFVSFEVPRRDSPLPATRPYSIASSPNRRDAIELVLSRVAGGPGSEYLFGLQKGDRTSFKGPTGTFVLRDSPRDLLFVVTGTGIAPIRSMLWSLAKVSPARATTLFWGLRSERDLYYQDELDCLRERLPRFSFVTTLSQPTPQWRGASGSLATYQRPHTSRSALEHRAKQRS